MTAGGVEQAAPVSGLLPRAVRVVGGDRSPKAGVLGAQLGKGLTPEGTLLTLADPSGSADVNAPTSDYYLTGTDLTVELWIRTTVTGRQVLVSNTQTLLLSSTTPEVMTITVENDRLGVSWDTTTGDDITSTDVTPVSDGSWHHVALVFGADGVTFYKDGAARDTLTLGNAHLVRNTWYLSAPPGAGGGIVGDVYDLRVWATLRDAAEIAGNRFIPPAPDAQSLSVLTSFDRTDGTAVNLRSGRSAAISGGRPVWGDLPVQPFVALQFTGTVPDEYVALGVDGGLTSDAATLECWVQIDPADTGITRTLLQGDNGSAPVPLFFYAGDDRLGLLWGDTRVTSTDTRVISDGLWHHLAVVIDRGTITFLKDGVPAADSFQMTTLQQNTTWFVLVSGAVSGIEPFRGRMVEPRLWATARTVAQIQAMRYVPLDGAEAGLLAIASLAGADPAQPATLTPVNTASSTATTVSGPVTAVVVDGPVQALPNPVWTSPLAGIAPNGPVISGQGAVYAENITDGSATSGWIRTVDLRSAEITWSYDVQANSSLDQTVVPTAVTVADGVVYAGGQATLYTEFKTIEINAVDAATGQPVAAPAVIPGTQFLTRLVMSNGTLFFGYHASAWTPEEPYAALSWLNPTTQALGYQALDTADTLTDPVVAGTTVFIASTVEVALPFPENKNVFRSIVYAIDTAAPSSTALLWTLPVTAGQLTDPLSITTGLAYAGPITEAITGAPGNGDGTLLVPLSDGSVVALDARTGSTLWSHMLSGAPVHSTPVVIGSVICVAGTDGVFYALDLQSGDELWRVDTGSAITTELIYQDGVLFFANQGDGQQVPPAFVSIDLASQGAAVLTYDVPDADTILFAEGASNGVAYFYGRQNVYAVDMRNVIHEFAVTTTLIVEDYDVSGDGPVVGNDTSYRVTLTLTDELGLPRVSQAVQVWSAYRLYLVNVPGSVGTPVEIGPDQPLWLQTDNLGTLTVAVSAFDNGTPGGTPNLACPALFAWGNFMGAGEAIVIYPDHDHLTTLATVQGSTSDGVGAAPGVRYLADATGYDGKPLIDATYQSPQALSAIANSVRSMIGRRSGPSVAAGVSAAPGAATPTAKYLTDPASMPGVAYTPDSSAATTRAWVPGDDAAFTVIVSPENTVYEKGNFDPSRPTTDLVGAPQLGGIWSDISDFVVNVIHGAEHVFKAAWNYVDNAVDVVIHTAESTYNLTITTIEDAITVVTGFLKTVIADIKRAIQWLSTLLQWDNFLANHDYIRLAIVNPAYDPSQPAGTGNQPGILDELRQWVSTESGKLAGGQQTVFDTVAAKFGGKGSGALSDVGGGLQGRSVQTTRASSGSSDSVYNYGGTDNAGQGRWLQQKVSENSTQSAPTGFSVGRSVRDTPPVSGGTVTAAGQRFYQQLDAAITGSFAEFPAQLHASMKSLTDTLTDPRALLSTGLADVLAVFETIANDAISLFEALIPAFLDLLETLLDQIVSWLDEPIDIPFVSALYQRLTGNPLSVLDLVCLLAALPATLILDVITGSPTPAAPTELEGTAGAEAGDILLGIASFVVADVAAFIDILALDFSLSNPDDKAGGDLASRIDFAADFLSYALGMVASRGWSEWDDKDWAFWAGTGVIQVVNFIELFAPNTPYGQPARDAALGLGFLIMSAVYAGVWPDSYRDAPKAPGLVIAGNVFAALSGIVELPLRWSFPEPFGPEILIAKGVCAVVANVLGFTVDVIGIVNA